MTFASTADVGKTLNEVALCVSALLLAHPQRHDAESLQAYGWPSRFTQAVTIPLLELAPAQGCPVHSVRAPPPITRFAATLEYMEFGSSFFFSTQLSHHAARKRPIRVRDSEFGGT